MKRFLFWLALSASLLALLLGVASCTEHGYLVAAVRDTYLRGRLTPPITVDNSYLTRQTRVLPVGKPQPWPLDAHYMQSKLPAQTAQRMMGYRTAAFVVLRRGALLHETYWDGFDRESRSNSNSVAKSWLSALVGIAVNEGALRGIDQPVGDFIPEFRDGARATLTIRHLLTMSAASNFEEDYDNPLAFPARAHYGPDLIRTLVERFRVDAKPGVTHKYDSASSALLGLVLTRATGMSLSEYLAKKLWQPLGAEQPALWALDHADGFEKAYCCLYASARDYARLGQLYLQQGQWQGRELVPRQYVADSVASAPLLGADHKATARYGYSWWRTTHAGHEVFYAWGYQGQYIAVIPDRQIVMVRLGDGGGYTQQHHVLDLPVYLAAALDLAEARP